MSSEYLVCPPRIICLDSLLQSKLQLRFFVYQYVLSVSFFCRSFGYAGLLNKEFYFTEVYLTLDMFLLILFILLLTKYATCTSKLVKKFPWNSLFILPTLSKNYPSSWHSHAFDRSKFPHVDVFAISLSLILGELRLKIQNYEKRTPKLTRENVSPSAHFFSACMWTLLVFRVFVADLRMF